MTQPEFKKVIWEFYKQNKREMPWRKTWNPYYILISEVMLQQTQVPRVMQKYKEFLSKFPNFESLANASTATVLKVWSGMGYNRRALYLKNAAEIVMQKYSGKLPKDPVLLDELPGIGYATSHSIATFAFNYKGVFIETNIRRVFIHFFFNNQENVDDKDILVLVEQTVDNDNPREWYYALMDYGTMLAKTMENPNKKSKHYSVQSKFEGSDRQMRGEILKELGQHEYLNGSYFVREASDKERVKRSLESLKKEGFISEEKGVYRIKV